LLNYQKGKIVEIKRATSGMFEIVAEIQGERRNAISLKNLNPIPEPGDEIILNTTAQDLKLGSGGFDFILFNEKSGILPDSPKEGHIMKLRYTPMQFSVLSCEEENSPHRAAVEKQLYLDGIPVVIGLLHSHLVPAVLALNFCSQGSLRIVYLMTDGGALPIAISKQVEELKKRNLLAGTVTIGHSFGGSLECINIYSGLLASRAIFKADVIVAVMGPGITGTNSKYGFSGIEQGEIANAVYSLRGKPFIIPRVSFADPRKRHQGLSHHTLTILSNVALCEAIVGLPYLEKDKELIIEKQLKINNLDQKHLFLKTDASSLEKELSRLEMDVFTMGRSFREDREFFEAAWSTAAIAAELHKEIN